MSTKYKNSSDVPTATIIARFEELSDAIAGGYETRNRKFTMRIPTELDRDADLMLAEAAAETTINHLIAAASHRGHDYGC